MNTGLDNRLANRKIDRTRTPLLARLALAAVMWVGLYGATYILFDTLGIWAHLPESFTRVLDLLTGSALLTALIAHLLLSTGRLPESRGSGS
jgi:hypothetical protein